MSQLRRILGVRALALTMVNLTIGAGIFGLPALAARELGVGALFAYLVCMGLVGLVGLCLAEAGSRVLNAGGLYGYARASFGPVVGTVTGHLLWFANGAVGNAAVAVLLADTLGVLVPWLAGPLPRAAVLVGYYAILVVVNVRGTRQGAGLSQVTTVLKLVPLVALVLCGLPFVHGANLHLGELPSARGLGRTSVLLFFAFMGFESGLGASAEVSEPARTVPRALLFALTLVGATYLGLQIVAQGVLGPALATAGDAPLGATAVAAFGPFGGTVMLLAAVLATAGGVAADTLATSRVVHALGLDGALPRRLGRVDDARATPAAAIVSYAVVCAVLALSGTFRVLATLSASGTLCVYLVCCVGVLRLRARGVRSEREPFVVPGGPLVPVLAALTVLAVLGGLERRDFLALGAMLGVTVILALLRRREARRGNAPGD
ncbi:MAG TPA: APC family permease [Polyangiaceae bacterium]